MEFANLGSHCALQDCHTKDFLPIKCRCGGLYCVAHRMPGSHSCSAQVPDRQPLYRKEKVPKKDRCSFRRCKQGHGYDLTNCRHCTQHFCLNHRFPSDHVCTGITDNNHPLMRSGSASLTKPSNKLANRPASSCAKEAAVVNANSAQPIAGKTNVSMSRLVNQFANQSINMPQNQNNQKIRSN